jgi:hypothetical protein
MPGINIVINEKIKQTSIEELKYEPHIKTDQIINDEFFSFVFSGFSGYPTTRYDFPHYLVYIEGLIYNKDDDDIKQQLKALADHYLENNDFIKNIRNFVESSDGDYLILIYFKGLREFMLFNDRWGKLPCFYYNYDRKLVISRELKFILHYCKEIELDKESIIEYLVLRFPFGGKTVFKNIFTLKPGHLIVYNKEEKHIIPISTPKFKKETEPLSWDESISKAKCLLLESIKARFDKLTSFKTLVVDISGGYDSRCIFAAAATLDQEITPTTISLITGDESEVAKKVSTALGYDMHYLRPTHDLSYSTMKEILAKTDGFINGETATSCYQNKQLVYDTFDIPIAEFEGFGGDYVRHPKRIRSYYNGLVDVVYDTISLSLIKNVCFCLDYDEKKIKKYWKEFFEKNYVEEDFEDQILHYYFDYQNLYVGKGEDRDRRFLWTINPMTSNKWLDFALNKIPRHYRSYKFLADLIDNINPKVSVQAIPPFNDIDRSLKGKIISKFKNQKTLRNFGKRISHLRYKRILSSDPKRISMKNEIMRIYQECKLVNETFNENGINRFINSEFSKDNAYLLQMLSLFLYLEAVQEKISNSFKSISRNK